MPLETGAIVEATVTRLVEYGAFVELPEGNSGMIHISEVADSFVKNLEDFLKVGELVKVKILSVNENGKYVLSLKQAARSGKQKGDREGGFEGLMDGFLKESKERLSELKKNTEAKRGRGRAR